MRMINQIVIHCSDTPAGMDIGVKEIREWHTALPPRGNGWADCGYHWVIRRNGKVEQGRPEEMIGAHVQNHNANSIGICMVGGGQGICNFRNQQWLQLEDLVRAILKRYPDAEVLGHRDLNPDKACPTFSAKDWWDFSE